MRAAPSRSPRAASTLARPSCRRDDPLARPPSGLGAAFRAPSSHWRALDAEGRCGRGGPAKASAEEVVLQPFQEISGAVKLPGSSRSPTHVRKLFLSLRFLHVEFVCRLSVPVRTGRSRTPSIVLLSHVLLNRCDICDSMYC